MESWTKKELSVLREYDRLSNEYAGTPAIVRDGLTMGRILYLEAVLLASNKLVIGYLGDEPVGVYSFNKALKKELYFQKLGKLFIWHPVNFTRMSTFVDFIQG